MAHPQMAQSMKSIAITLPDLMAFLLKFSYRKINIQDHLIGKGWRTHLGD